MRANVQPDGSLLVTASNIARRCLREAYEDGGYPAAEALVRDALRDSVEFIEPADIGALTEAPILAIDCEYPEDGGTLPADGAAIWWFPDYAVRDPWEELKTIGRVVFSRAWAAEAAP